MRPPSADALRARILEAVERERAPSRALWRRLTAGRLALGFLFAGAIASIELLGRTAGWSFVAGRNVWHVVADGQVPTNDPPANFVVVLELGWVLVASMATWAGATRGRSMLGRSSVVKLSVAVLTPAVLVLTWLAAALLWRTSVLPAAWLEVMTGDAVEHHVRCALISVSYAVGPMIALFSMRHRREPATPRQTGAAFGTVAGAWGATFHLVFCPCASPLHMALGHVLPVIVLAAVGALAGERFLNVSPAQRFVEPLRPQSI